MLWWEFNNREVWEEHVIESIECDIKEVREVVTLATATQLHRYSSIHELCQIQHSLLPS
jgi:hypothetical protein